MLLNQLFDVQREKLLELQDVDLLSYLKDDIYQECLNEQSLSEFLELN